MVTSRAADADAGLQSLVLSFRQMILTGCVAFARHVGPTRVEAELLPQCWEQVNSCIGSSLGYWKCSHCLLKMLLGNMWDINYARTSLAQPSDLTVLKKCLACFALF